MSRNFELMRSAHRRGGPPQVSPVIESPPVRQVPAADDEASDWLRFTSILAKHWKLSAAFAITLLAAVAAITFLMRPVYEPEARIEVDPPGAEIFSMQNGGMGSNDSEFLDTQIQKLQSDELALDVIRKLHLDQNPDLVGRRALADSGANDPLRQMSRENAALRAFKANLTVKRDTTSRLLSVRFASHDPKTAAQVLNTLVERFIEKSYETRHEAVMQSSQWLSRQLDDIRGKMDESNRALADYQKSSGITDLDDNKTTFAEQMAELNRQLTQAQGERIQLESYLKSMQYEGATLPQADANPVVHALEQKAAEVKADLANARVIYGPNHPSARKLESQAAELDRQLRAQRQGIVSTLQTSYAAARRREQLLEEQVEAASHEMVKMARYNELKGEAQTNTELYKNLYARVKEAGIAAESKSSNVRVADQARVLDRPTRPNRPLDLAIALFVGVFGGAVLAFVKEGLVNTIQTPQDARRYTGSLGASIVPAIERRNALPALAQTSTLRRLLGKRDSRVERFVLERPRSPESEALQALRTSVLLSRPDAPPRVILVVSGSAGEGKTTVATNLAIALAQNGRTCLVDADLRRPGIARAFNVESDRGLSDVLRSELAMEDAFITPPETPGVTLLPAGVANEQATVLFASAAMTDLVWRLRQSFEHIVIDTPPLLPYADARAIAPLADGVILVGRSGVTTRDALLRSMELLASVHSAPILEFVLNGADYSAPEYRYYRQYGYGRPA